MKIGILTFHCAYNYGAVLQAFGLQEFLIGFGHEVEIIDYRPSYLLGPYYVFPVKWTVQRLFRRANSLDKDSIFPEVQKNPSTQKKAFWFIDRAKRFISRALWCVGRRRAFKNFTYRKLNLSRKRFSECGVPKQKYDAIIFGSDQIWNPRLTLGDPVFIGNFATDEKTLRIAYAASAGEASEALGATPAFVNALKNFDAISVREQNLADVLKKNFEGEIKVVLDPTLLVEKSVWDRIAIQPKRKRKYVLIYQLTQSSAFVRIAHELAEQLDADVVSVGSCYVDRPKGDLAEETPEKFVGWFKDAACVVTTSFHGTAFSIIYKKPIYYVSEGDLGENRAIHILRELGLLDRIVGEDAHPKFSDLITATAQLVSKACEMHRERF